MVQSKGYAAQTAKANLAPWNFQRRAVGAGDVLVEILYSGVCHSDLHQIRDEWFPGIFPMVPGHEIVGRVSQVGADVKKFKAGDLVGVGTMVDSCGNCENCKQDMQQFCVVSPVQTYNNLDKHGVPTYGGYSNNIVVREEFVLSVSDKLSLAGVAPLLCAGITTYSPLRNWKVGKGHKLAVLGLGGLGHMAVKFGVAFGAEVTVLSTSASKEKDARALGAHHFVVTSDAAQVEKVKGSFDFILDTVSAKHDLNMYLTLLKVKGVHICVGAPPEPHEIHAFSVIVGNKAVAGSGVGGLQQTQEMLDFCAEKNITADIELIDMKDIHKAYERMERGDVRYRFVIDIATL
jgi:uncharacterized zinc-type alcohol dehydrogenase-like protein